MPTILLSQDIIKIEDTNKKVKNCPAKHGQKPGVLHQKLRRWLDLVMVRDYKDNIGYEKIRKGEDMKEITAARNVKRVFMMLILVMVYCGLASAVTIKPESCDQPMAGAENPEVPTGYAPKGDPSQGSVGTGGKGVGIVRPILHFPLEGCGKSVQKAEFKISENSTINLTKGRLPAPFPTDIMFNHIAAVNYPHDPWGTGNYWQCVSAEFGVNPLDSVLLVKGGTKLNNTPITVDVTKMVNNDLAEGRKVVTFRIQAVNSEGDGFIAYLGDIKLEVQKREEEMTSEDKFKRSWKPVAEQMPFEPIWSHKEAIQLICQQKLKLSLPPAPAGGKYTALRFQTRLIYPSRSGWNTYLGIWINGEGVSGTDKYVVSRLLNRSMVFNHNYGGSPGTEYLVSGNRFNTFFSPDYEIDKSVTDAKQFREGTWFVLRVGDILKSDEPNTLELMNFAEPKYFGKKDPEDVIVEVASLELGYTSQLTEISGLRGQEVSVKFSPEAAIKEKDYQLSLSKIGGMHIEVAEESFYLDSKFSYPNAGFNHFLCEEKKKENWKPTVEIEKKSFTIRAENKFYRLERRGTCYKEFIEIQDKFTNRTNEVLGIIAQNRLVSTKMPMRLNIGGVPLSGDISSMGTPENPTLFLGQEKSGVGLFAQDTPFRNQLRIEVKGNQALFGTNQLGLAPKESYTLRWRIYPTKDNDYFTFINRLRADLGCNFTIQGPFQFFYNIRDSYLQVTPEYLQTRLKKQYIAIASLFPWFLYDDPGARMTRSQYSEKMKPAVANIKKGVPELKLISQFQITLQAVPIEADWEKWPTADGFIRGEDGKVVKLERNIPKGKTNLWSYPSLGSNYLKQILKDIDMCMDEIGFNGIYFDCFGFTGMKTYDRWDGRTVEIDPETYTVKRKLCLVAILAGPAQKVIVEHVLKKGGVVVNNMFLGVEELQGLPIFSFYEIGLNAAPINKGHLWTPIGLSLSWYSPPRTGRELVEAVIQRLREGGLFYYYHTYLREEDEEAYQLVEHMYPITITKLHRGWIEGKERIITCLPMEFLWRGEKPPYVLVFNSQGKKVTYDKSPIKVEEGWKVDITSLPGGGIAILEQSR